MAAEFQNKDFQNQDNAKIYKGLQGITVEVPAGLATADKQDDQSKYLQNLTDKTQFVNLTTTSFNSANAGILSNAIRTHFSTYPDRYLISMNIFVDTLAGGITAVMIESVY